MSTEREAFEAFLGIYAARFEFDRYGPNGARPSEYRILHVQQMWEAWQARAQPAITSESGNQAAQGASAITSESAQAVPLLTEQEVDSVWDAIPQTQFWWRRYARAIEQAVRAKQAPLPAEQIQKLRHLIDWTDSESYLTFARAIEAAHGIVGKEGA